jgi:hypothetical protein
MFFEQNPILDALWTIGVFVAAWCLATLVMAFLGYSIHNGLWWTEPRLDLNGNGGRRPAAPMFRVRRASQSSRVLIAL